MFFAIRTALIWLAALAIPVQGVAAATMLFCGPAHHRMAHALAVGDRHDASAAMQDHGIAGHEHAAAHSHEEGSSSHGSAKLTHLGKFTCSACASCCSMLALPTTLLPLGEPEAAIETRVAVRVGVPDFVTEGLERPPRFSLV